jgi:hypothetical protein
MFQVGDMIKQNIGHTSTYHGIVAHVDIETDEVTIDWLDWENLVKPTKTTQHIARLIWVKVNE